MSNQRNSDIIQRVQGFIKGVVKDFDWGGYECEVEGGRVYIERPKGMDEIYFAHGGASNFEHMEYQIGQGEEEINVLWSVGFSIPEGVKRLVEVEEDFAIPVACVCVVGEEHLDIWDDDFSAWVLGHVRGIFDKFKMNNVIEMLHTGDKVIRVENIQQFILNLMAYRGDLGARYFLLDDFLHRLENAIYVDCTKWTIYLKNICAYDIPHHAGKFVGANEWWLEITIGDGVKRVVKRDGWSLRDGDKLIVVGEQLEKLHALLRAWLEREWKHLKNKRGRAFAERNMQIIEQEINNFFMRLE